MSDANEFLAKAANYATQAQTARFAGERERLLRMERSYTLMARSAEFGTKLDDLIRTLRT